MAMVLAFVVSGRALADVADAPATVETAARAQVERALAEAFPNATRLEVRRVGTVKDVSMDTGARAVARSVRTESLGSRVSVFVDVVRAGRVTRSVPVTFAIAAYVPVLVTAHALRPGERLSGSDVTVSERDVTALSGDIFESIADVEGMRTRRYLAAGAIVTGNDVAALPAVARHQEVEVTVVTPTVRIEARGVAQEDGEAGETIRVRNAANDALFVGQVVDRGRVLVSGR